VTTVKQRGVWYFEDKRRCLVHVKTDWLQRYLRRFVICNSVCSSCLPRLLQLTDKTLLVLSRLLLWILTFWLHIWSCLCVVVGGCTLPDATLERGPVPVASQWHWLPLDCSSTLSEMCTVGRFGIDTTTQQSIQQDIGQSALMVGTICLWKVVGKFYVFLVERLSYSR